MQHVANELESTALDRSAISPDFRVFDWELFVLGGFIYIPAAARAITTGSNYCIALHYPGKVGPAAAAAAAHRVYPTYT